MKLTDLRKALRPVHSVAMAMKVLLQDCSKRVRLDAKLATEVKLRALACDLLIALATQADDQQSIHTVLPSPRASEIARPSPSAGV